MNKIFNKVFTDEQIIGEIRNLSGEDNPYGNRNIKLLLSLLDSTLENQIAILDISPLFIEYIDNHTDGLMEAVLDKHPSLINYFLNASEQMKEAAVRTIPELIQKMKNPSDKIKLIAVQSYPQSIGYITEQNEEIAKTAVMGDPLTLVYVELALRTFELQKIAVSLDPKCYEGLTQNIPADIITSLIAHPLFVGNNEDQSEGHKNILNKILHFDNLNCNHLSKLQTQFLQSKAQRLITKHPQFKKNASLILANIIEELN